ncbi:xanthine dehydrogenase family protein molybdopterin-binding subunit [Dehalococcoidia bacterium]|nr:xanthine dehydrogenase family protein molybdopterin-binding subunit [Dehalococcoidia bacterium]
MLAFDKETVDRVTGGTQFTGDLIVPGMATGKVLRSPYAHAKIIRIDTSRAEAMPGVFGVLTSADFKDIKPFYGLAYRDQPILAMEKARYEGEPVVAVAAVDEATAAEAIASIEIEYELLPVAVTLDQALADTAPLVHSERLEKTGHYPDVAEIQPIDGTNICHNAVSEIGDVEKGMAEADRVFENTFICPPVNHYTMEPLATTADYQGDHIKVWSSTQTPFHVRNELAWIFGLPLSKVRVIVPPLGGGFGGKCYTRIEPLVVALSMKAKRPVQILYDANETFHSICRCGFHCKIRTGVKSDGTMVACDVVFHLNCGAYSVNGPRLSSADPPLWVIPYRVPNVRVNSYAVYTNTVPNAVLRGAPGPHAGWVRESQVDIIARGLGISPVDFRVKNLLDPFEPFMPGWAPLNFDFKSELHRVVQLINWRSSTGHMSKLESEKLHGAGIVCFVKGYKSTGGPIQPHASFSSVSLRLGVDGSLVISTSAVDMGQGVHKALARIAATQLGISLEQIKVTNPDSDVTPYEHPTSGSRTTMNVGRAVESAAVELRQRLAITATQMLEVATNSLQFTGGFIQGEGRRISLEEVMRRQPGLPPAGGEIVAHAVDPGQKDGSSAEVGVAGVELEVDQGTGKVHILKYISVLGLGKAINTIESHQQNEGSAIYTLGHALSEEMIYSDNGQLLNGNLLEYPVPRCNTVPLEFESILVEENGGPGPAGSRGIGEAGGLAVMPLIANALHDATGVRFNETPFTPGRIIEGIAGQH